MSDTPLYDAVLRDRRRRAHEGAAAEQALAERQDRVRAAIVDTAGEQAASPSMMELLRQRPGGNRFLDSLLDGKE